MRRLTERTLLPAALVLLSVLVSGSVASGAAGTPAKARAEAGQLDSSFGGTGMVTTRWATGSVDEAHAVAIQSDGKILAAGTSEEHFAVGRYNTDGSVDTAFGDKGEATSYFDLAANDSANAVAVQVDGKIVAAGVTAQKYQLFAIARYNTDGSPDNTFSGNGMATTHFGARSIDLAFAVAVQPNGKIVVAGVSNDRFALARYNANGALDTSFSGDGKVTTQISSGSQDQAQAVALQPDGKIVVAGETFPARSSTANFALARYTSRGVLDSTFGGDGKVITGFASGSDDSANAVTVEANGRILAAGFTHDRFALARYTSGGRLDATWGGDGKVTTHFLNHSTDTAQAVGIQSDGKVVAAGDSFSSYHDHFALARYKSNGALDGTFGSYGKVTTEFSSQSQDVAFAVGIQSDGKIVAVGRCSPTTYYSKFALARYLAS